MPNTLDQLRPSRKVNKGPPKLGLFTCRRSARESANEGSPQTELHPKKVVHVDDTSRRQATRYRRTEEASKCFYDRLRKNAFSGSLPSVSHNASAGFSRMQFCMHCSGPNPSANDRQRSGSPSRDRATFKTGFKDAKNRTNGRAHKQYSRKHVLQC
jgi:hypothetical protein